MTKEEMKDFLKRQYSRLSDVESDDFNFSMEAAIYWFASDYHSGQASDLYSILSTSDFSPSRMSSGIDSEDEEIKMLYHSLVDKYGSQEKTENRMLEAISKSNYFYKKANFGV